MMPAKAQTEESKPKAERPADLNHIRVGPVFEGKIGGRCIVCKAPTKGKQAHIVENTRTDSRKAICHDCLEEDPALAARQVSDDLDSFLA